MIFRFPKGVSRVGVEYLDPSPRRALTVINHESFKYIAPAARCASVVCWWNVWCVCVCGRHAAVLEYIWSVGSIYGRRDIISGTCGAGRITWAWEMRATQGKVCVSESFSVSAVSWPNSDTGHSTGSDMPTSERHTGQEEEVESIWWWWLWFSFWHIENERMFREQSNKSKYVNGLLLKVIFICIMLHTRNNQINNLFN